MKLEFLKERYPDLPIDFFADEEGEWAYIHPVQGKPLYVGYIPDDWTPFSFRFGMTHGHECDEEGVLEQLDDYISGRDASVEFFQDGKPRFGGIIDPSVIWDRDFEALCRWFKYTYSVFRGLEFILEAWDPAKCCRGRFERNAEGKPTIVID